MIRAVIFDLDGTVLDNESDWEEAFNKVALRNSIEIPESKRLRNGWIHEPGMGISPIWKRLILDPMEVEELSKETWQEYWKTVRTPENIFVREGIVELVEKAKEKNWLTGLCTGSSWNVVESELEQLGLVLAFDVTTTGEEIFMPKPDPEIYFLTAQKMGFDPSECLVVEDSIAGMRSALEAGSVVVGLVSDYAPERLIRDVGVKHVVGEIKDALKIVSTL